jgi:hypothetical protein
VSCAFSKAAHSRLAIENEVTNMQRMFETASSFNQPGLVIDVSNVNGP